VLFPTVPPVDENTQIDRADRSCAPAGGGCQNSSPAAPAAPTFDEARLPKARIYQRLFALQPGTARAIFIVL
jgi:hypothetical protein